MQSKLCRIVLALLLAITTASFDHAQAAKVLGLFPHAGESHYAVMRSVVLELARRGHNVTLYSSHRLNELNLEHVEEHIIEPEFEFWRTVQRHAGIRSGSSNAIDLPALSALQPAALQRALAAAGADSVGHFLAHSNVQQLLALARSDEFDYDLIVVDMFYSDALVAMGHVHGTPTVGIVSVNFENYMQHVLENIMPVACSPNDGDDGLGFSPAANYWQRLSAVRECTKRRKQFATDNTAAQEAVIRKHFADFGAPTLLQLQASTAMLLFNTHTLLERPRPLLQNTIFAGGFHIRSPRELPWHVLRFVEESRIGVIYIHLGDAQMCADLAAERLQTLFAVLGARRERVIWSCHDVNKLPDLPKNFMLLQHVVDQTDILAHPHIKAFIMNGDLLGVQEAIVRHVPLVAIPLFREEIHNAAIAERLGIAVQLDYANVTETSLAWALDRLLYDESYQLAVRKVSKLYRDRPFGALETCMYWMEYLLRHGTGGAELRTSGLGMSSKQLHLFDLFIFYILVVLLSMGVIAGICYKVIQLLWQPLNLKGKMTSKLN